MPAVTGHNWYAANALRPFPIDDLATGRDDTGTLVPHAVLADLRARVAGPGPVELHVAGLTVTSRLTTVVVVRGSTPVLAVVVLAPVEPYRAYAMEALEDGAAGWVVFGPFQETYIGRFASASQSRLDPSCVHVVGGGSVRSVGLHLAEPGLVGDVELVGAGDLRVEPSWVEGDAIGGPAGLVVPAIYFGLQAAPGRDVLAEHAGPCGGAPESNTCAQPTIASISGVVPDCTGAIRLRFPKADIYPFPGGVGGAFIDPRAGVAASCPGRGITPPDYEDWCSSSLVSSSLPEPPDASSSLPTVPCPSLPFTNALAVDPDTIGWSVVAGSFLTADAALALYSGGADDPDPTIANWPRDGADDLDPCWCAASPSGRSVIVWFERVDCPYGAIHDTQIAADVAFGDGARAEFGLVLNHRTGPDGRPRYLVAGVDAFNHALVLWEYNGSSESRLNVSRIPVATSPLTAGHWYRLSVIARPVDGAPASAVVVVTLEDGPTTLASFTLITPRFGEPTGIHGLGTFSSRAWFRNLVIEDV